MSTRLSVQQFKINYMLNAIDKWCIMFVVQYNNKIRFGSGPKWEHKF